MFCSDFCNFRNFDFWYTSERKQKISKFSIFFFSTTQNFLIKDDKARLSKGVHKLGLLPEFGLARIGDFNLVSVHNNSRFRVFSSVQTRKFRSRLVRSEFLLFS